MPVNISFDGKNAKSCLCIQCPVQTRSACANEKDSEAGVSDPLPKESPRLYCSKGLAGCKDIDSQATCICGSCPVWKANGLAKTKPAYHFCVHGKPK